MNSKLGVCVAASLGITAVWGCQPSESSSIPPASTALPAAHAGAPKAKLYDESADAKRQIAAALAEAKAAGAGGKRVFIQWGGNWCGWCLRLNKLLTSDTAIEQELREHYVVVHIDTGMPDGKNVALAEGYGARVNEDGYPYLTVLGPDGEVIANHDSGSFEFGPIEEGHDPAKVLAWLKHPTSNAPAAGH